jgi:SPP1 family predicted phage head-tail adaptor
MNIPRLSRKLALEEQVREPDLAGGFVTTWQALGVLWANVERQSGSETLISGRTASIYTYRVIVRAAPPSSPQRPTPAQRFREGERIFTIRTVSDFDREGRYLECTADEEVAA